MLESINDLLLAIGDPLLNWLLRLPRDVAILIVAVGTGAIITGSRLFTTDQDLLWRCGQDKRRLGELVREAKRGRDKEAVKRHRLTKTLVDLKAMRQEFWPLVAALVPIAILGTWCFQRLAFLPPRAGDALTLEAFVPVSAIGSLAHVVPQPGVEEVSGAERPQWIATVGEYDDPAFPAAIDGGVARWRLRAAARPEPYRLTIRHRDCSVEKRLLVGQPTYAAEIEIYPPGSPIEYARIAMQPAKFLGLVPGIERFGVPPWLVAYFLIAIPSVSLLKRLTGIR